jgi:hypothetical protein
MLESQRFNPTGLEFLEPIPLYLPLIPTWCESYTVCCLADGLTLSACSNVTISIGIYTFQTFHLLNGNPNGIISETLAEYACTISTDLHMDMRGRWERHATLKGA